MSWLYSRALVAAYSAATFSAGAQSAELSWMLMPQAFWSHAKTTAHSHHSRYGTTLRRLPVIHGEALLTWFREVSRVRTSAHQARVLGSMASDPAYGGTWHESSVRFDRATHTWRTHQCLWDEVLPESSVTLPRWGMTRDGVLWVPGTSVLSTSEIASGSSEWIPTPTTPNGGRVNKAEDVLNKGTTADGQKRQVSLESYARLWPTPRNNTGPSTDKQHLSLDGAVRLWPTPLATDGAKGGPNQRGGKGDLRLSSAVQLWPTPTVNDSKSNGTDSQLRRKGLNLNAAATLFPTPTAADAHGHQYQRDRGQKGKERPTLVGIAEGWLPTPTATDGNKWNNKTVAERKATNSSIRLPNVVSPGAGGKLNPRWVEWLMGWPIGWTSLEPLDPQVWRDWLTQQQSGTWWQEEPPIPRVINGLKHRNDQLRAIGNGQVSAAARAAWRILTS